MAVRNSESGQSILEFLMMLPVLVGLVVVMVRVNTVIQIGINNQKFARSQALLITFNSAVYPDASIRNRELNEKGFNQMVLGVSNEAPPSNQNPAPKPPRYKVSKSRSGTNDCSDSGIAGGKRAMVCVRNTVTLCTQTNVMTSSGNTVPVLKLEEASSEPFKPKRPYNIPYPGNYCSSPLKYLEGDDSEGAT